MKRALILVAIAIATGAPSATWACGVCVEDAVAATYDRVVIDAAMARSQHVVFVAVEGPISRAKLNAGIRAAASRIRGVQTGTLRTSVSPPAFSFALDAAQTPEVAVSAFRKAIGSSSTRLTLVRIIRNGALIEPG